jgi:beta-glucosidase
MGFYHFPDDFTWGTATSSYQIEGATRKDGRGESIWDEYCRQPGAVINGETGDVACDYYHRWEEDLDLLKELGVSHYRFSVAWPRIIPSGRGAVNQAGLDFYDKIINGLLERDIVPFLTLYHWDLPLELEKQGGWRSRETAYAYAEYTEVVTKAFGDRVKFWTTFNEMPCIVNLGYRTGEQAPGARESEQVVRQVNHHVLLAHGLGAQIIQKNVPEAETGIVHLIDAPDPLTETDEDIEAARKGFVESNSWMLDPVFLGKYPEEIWNELDHDVPKMEEGDLKTIHQPLSFMGVNAYSSWKIASKTRGIEEPEDHFPRTDMDWPITNDCLYWAIRFGHERYNFPKIYVTESGCAYPDAPDSNGDVVDYARVHYMRNYLRGVHRTIGEGIPVKGYFAWSFMDNFEWSYGYDKRFGLTYIDYASLKRIPKVSFKWYSKVIRNNSL